MAQAKRESQLLRMAQGSGLLTGAAISSLIAGVWGLTFLGVSAGTAFMKMSSTLFRPIIETLWGETYFTYPYMFLSDVVGYVFLVTITAPIAIYYGRNIYRAGSGLKVNSLKLIGIVCLAIVAASMVVVPFAYQEALEAIALYKRVVAQGVLINIMFIPLGLPAIQLGLSAFVLVAASVFTIGAIEMKCKTSCNFFTVAGILATISLLVVSSSTLMILSESLPVTVSSIGSNNFAILTLAITVILFGVGLGELGTRSESWKGGCSPTHHDA